MGSVPHQHWSFFSPNTEEGLNLEQASQRLRSSNHQAWRKIAQDIVTSLGLHHQTRSHDAIGAWFDETGHHYSENSLMHVIEGEHDPKVVQYLANWLGLLGNQKAVITFHSGKDGPDYLYQVHVPEHSAQKVVDSLKRHGIPYHTLVPNRRGHSVVVWDQGRQNKSNIEKFAQEHHAVVSATPGIGEYTGESSRPAARQLYRSKIKEFEATRSSGQGTAPQEAGGGGPTRTPSRDLPPALTRQAFRKKGKVRKYSRSDEDGFHQALDQNPQDWDTRRVYGDWLEENNRPDEAETQRWMAEKQKAPKGGPGVVAWMWGSEGMHRQIHGALLPLRHYHLPEHIVDHFQYPSTPNPARSRQQAERLLHVALHRAKKAGVDIWADPEEPEPRESLSRRGPVIRKRRKGPWVHYQAGVHAPHGGMIVRGQFFKGGEFIPASMLEPVSKPDGKTGDIGAEPKPQPNQTQSKPKSPPSPSGQSKTQEPRSKASSILSSVGSVPHKALTKAKSAIGSVWTKYEKRYGRRWAMAIVGAALVGIPIPVPGSMLMTTAATVALAEMYLKLKGKPLEKVEKQAGLDVAELQHLGRMFLNEVFARLGLERNQISQT